jgi:hypothetical protein
VDFTFEDIGLLETDEGLNGFIFACCKFKGAVINKLLVCATLFFLV